MADENNYEVSSNQSGGSSAYKTIVWILTFLLVLCIFAGVAYLVVYLVRRSNGMYVTYDGTYISASNDGIYIDFTDDHSFFIKNDSGWGSYSVESCEVKVLNNVSFGSKYDFDYAVSGESHSFSDVEDFTSCFSSGVISVSSDGSFELSPQGYFYYVADVLASYYGCPLDSCSSRSVVSSYPFFKLSVSSPDESSFIEIPFSFYQISSPLIDIWISEGHLYF